VDLNGTQSGHVVGVGVDLKCHKGSRVAPSTGRGAGGYRTCNGAGPVTAQRVGGDSARPSEWQAGTQSGHVVGVGVDLKCHKGSRVAPSIGRGAGGYRTCNGAGPMTAQGVVGANPTDKCSGYEAMRRRECEQKWFSDEDVKSCARSWGGQPDTRVVGGHCRPWIEEDRNGRRVPEPVVLPQKAEGWE